jgi:predicted ATPase
MEGGTIQTITARARLARNRLALSADESAVVALLEQRLRRKTA